MSSRSSRFLPLFLLTAAVAPAANLTFVPAGDGASASLNEAASWSTGALPTATDGMLFTDPGTYTATATDSLSAGAFTQRNGNVTFSLGGNTLSVLGDFSFNSTADDGVHPSFTLRSGTIGAGRTYLGMGTGPVDVTLTGSGSVFRPGNGYIGYAAPDCTLSVLEGAAFAPTNTFGIGYLGTSSGNRMVVSGEGSTHTIPRGFRFYAGENGSGNTVVYSDGASLLGESGSIFALGWNAAACCNTVLVHGASTTFLPQTVNVGNNGSSNLLEIAGGATVTINSLSVNARNGQGNRMLVRDASTLILTNGTTGVQNTGILTVSGEGTKMFLRQITVESGGRLEILDGAVSTNRSALAIGSNGRGGAEMIISNATHHSATIVNVGNYTSNCVLRVMDGATLSCPDSFLDIGSFNSASNNTAIIEGEGSSAVFSRFRIGGLSKDGIMIVRNNYFWGAGYDKIDFIANGDMATVRRVGRRMELYGFHFVKADLKIDDYEEELSAWLMLDTLMAGAPALTYEQNRTLYRAVEADYAHIGSKKKRLEEIRKNEYYNALQIKFAYAVTCHKAQGGQWDAVFIDQGYLTDDMLTDEYWRWLYTAITRARKRLYFINFNDSFFQGD